MLPKICEVKRGVEPKQTVKMDLDIKSFATVKQEDGTEFVEFEGYASTRSIDKYGDIVLPEAFSGSLEDVTPMLWQHWSSEPIGIFPPDGKRIDQTGLWVKGKMPKSDTLVMGRVLPQMEVGSIKSMSIGFYTKKYSIDEENDIRTIIDLELVEISLVTRPAQPEATIESMKKGETQAGIISESELMDMSMSQLKYAIRSGLLSKNAASFVASLIIKAGIREEDETDNTEETGSPDLDITDEKFLEGFAKLKKLVKPTGE